MLLLLPVASILRLIARREGGVPEMAARISALCGAPHKADYVDRLIMLSDLTFPFPRLA